MHSIAKWYGQSERPLKGKVSKDGCQVTGRPIGDDFVGAS